jgi:non-homologous end joining protein Ku
MATAARSSWRGAFKILGFPVHVALYARTSEAKNISFRYLIGKQPAKSVYISTADFERREQAPKPKQFKVGTYTQSECAQGVEVAGGQFKVIPDAQITKIRDADRTKVAEPIQYVPLETVPLELAEVAYRVLPDDKVAGADTSATQAWNGLLDAKKAYVSRLTARAGSRDLILVLYAKQDGLWAVALPFATELKEIPEFDYVRDAKQGKLLASLIVDDELVGDFDHELYASEHRNRREKAIAKALGGKPIAEPKDAPKPKANDLMASLETAVKAKGKPKAAGKGRRGKVAAASKS